MKSFFSTLASMRSRRVLRRAAGLAGVALALAVPVRAQDLTVDTTLPPDGWVDADDSIEIVFGRPLDAPAERVAVFFDHVDVTDLFRRTADGLVYDPAAPPLPRGEGELVVYRVTADGWREVAREPLNVRSGLGFETSDWDPGVDISFEGQVAAGQDPEPVDDIKQFDQDLGGQITVSSDHTRGDLAIVSETTFLGSSARSQALRFSEDGRDAPKIDLSSYRAEYRQGPVSLAVGHVGFGSQRHLINGFNSRGTILGWSPHERFELAFAMVNGNNVVGWENVLGLEEPDHRLTTAMLGLEALERPGAMRVELTWLDASILPGRAGFNQGELNDAEESGGFAASVSSQTPGRRLAIEAGFSRSTYDNPFDPTLAQDDDLVEVEEETRNARYLEASVGLLRNVSLGETKSASLDLALRHERIDPEYQSVGAYARPDILQNAIELRGALGDVRFQTTHQRSEDNLDDIPSVLTTKTRRTGGNVSFPFARILGVDGPAAPWVPELRYTIDRTHQFGEGVPENSGFDPSHVPDQVSTNHTTDLAWRWSRVTFGWRLNLSDQDNRQEGRENADLENRTNALKLGLRPHDRVSLDLGLNLERRENVEREEVDETTRWSARTSISAFSASQLSLSWSTTHDEDEAGTRERDASSLDVQWSSAVPGLDRFGGQYFLRFSRSATETVDREFDVVDERSDWRLDSGLNFSFFQ